MVEPTDVGTRHFPPFYEFLGLEYPGDSDPSVAIALRPELLNSQGALHGGVITSLLDAALSRAIRLQVGSPIRLATVDLDVKFINPGTGPRVVAAGTVLKLSSRVAMVEAKAVSDGNVLVALGSAVFRVFSA